MANYKISFRLSDRTVRIQLATDATPSGYNVIGTFEHADTEAAITDLKFDVNHVLYHHIRDALYHTSAATGQRVNGTLVFPDNITDMASVTLVLDEVATAVLTNTVAPAITGTVQVGQTLTSSAGTWNPTGSTYTRQWQVADANTGPWTNIAGATATTYVPVVGQVGKFIRVIVTATNEALEQTVSANSASTVAVIAA